MYPNQFDKSTDRCNFNANKGLLLSQGDFARLSLLKDRRDPPFPLYFNFPPRYETHPENHRYQRYLDSNPQYPSSFEMAAKELKLKQGQEKRRTDYIAKNITDVQEASKLLRKSPGARHRACLTHDRAESGQRGKVSPSKRLIYPTPVTRKMRYPQLHELQELPVTKSHGHKDTPRPEKVGIKLDGQEISQEKGTKNSGGKATVAIDPPIKDVIVNTNEPAVTAENLSGIMKDLKISPINCDPQDGKSIDSSEKELEGDGIRRVSFEDKIQVIDSEESPEECGPKKLKRYISVCERKATPVPSLTKLALFYGPEIGIGDFTDELTNAVTHLRGDRLDLNESMDECSFVLNAIPDCYNVLYENEYGNTSNFTSSIVDSEDKQDESPRTKREVAENYINNESLDLAMMKASMLDTSHLIQRPRNDFIVRLDSPDANVIILSNKSDEKRLNLEAHISKNRRIISINLDQANNGEQIFDVKKGESFSLNFTSNVSFDVEDRDSRFTRSNTSINVNRGFEYVPSSANSSSSSLCLPVRNNSNFNTNFESVPSVNLSTSSLPVRKNSNLNVYAKPFYPSSSSASSSVGNLTRGTSESNTMFVNPFSQRFTTASPQVPVDNRLYRSPDYVVKKAAEFLGSLSETELQLERMLRDSEDFFEFP